MPPMEIHHPATASVPAEFTVKQDFEWRRAGWMVPVVGVEPLGARLIGGELAHRARIGPKYARVPRGDFLGGSTPLLRAPQSGASHPFDRA